MGKKSRVAESAPVVRAGKPSSLLDTRVVCGFEIGGDNLVQLAKLPDHWLHRATSKCVDLIYIDPAPLSEVERPFNSNRNYEVFWGETKEKRAFEYRHASTQAYIEYMRPRCVQLACVLKKTGSCSSRKASPIDRCVNAPSTNWRNDDYLAKSSPWVTKHFSMG